MQITLEQVYEKLQEFRDQSRKEMKELRQETQKEIKELRQDMDSKLAGVDGKFASMQAWVIGLMIGAAALTSVMGGVFIKMMMILVSR